MWRWVALRRRVRADTNARDGLACGGGRAATRARVADQSAVRGLRRAVHLQRALGISGRAGGGSRARAVRVARGRAERARDTLQRHVQLLGATLGRVRVLVVACSGSKRDGDKAANITKRRCKKTGRNTSKRWRAVRSHATTAKARGKPRHTWGAQAEAQRGHGPKTGKLHPTTTMPWRRHTQRPV